MVDMRVGVTYLTLLLLPQVRKNSTLVKASFPVKLKIGSKCIHGKIS